MTDKAYLTLNQHIIRLSGGIMSVRTEASIHFTLRRVSSCRRHTRLSYCQNQHVVAQPASGTADTVTSQSITFSRGEIVHVVLSVSDELKAQSSTTPYQLADQGVEGDIDGGARMQQQLVGRDLPQPTDYQKLSSIHRTTGSSSRHDGEGITGSRRRLPPQVPSRLSNVKDIESVSSGKGGPVPITGRSTFQCINRQASSVPRERSVGLVGRAHARLMSDAQRCAVFEQDSKISRV